MAWTSTATTTASTLSGSAGINASLGILPWSSAQTALRSAERGLALANLLGIPVFMIVKTADGFEERYSDAFKPYLKKRS